MSLRVARPLLSSDKADRAGVRHMTAFTYRFVPAMRYLDHLVKRGDLGLPYHYRSCRLQDWGTRNVGWRQVKKLAATGALLRVANSPVFRPRSAPRNVLEAVSLLGRTRSLATVASTALRSRCDGLDASAVDSLWRAGARAADAAFWACRASSCKSLADLTYLAALLQDVGTVVVLRRTPELAGLLRCAEPDLEAGIHQLDTASGTCHAAAGYLVARNWKLPVSVCARITCSVKSASTSSLRCAPSKPIEAERSATTLTGMDLRSLCSRTIQLPKGSRRLACRSSRRASGASCSAAWPRNSKPASPVRLRCAPGNRPLAAPATR